MSDLIELLEMPSNGASADQELKRRAAQALRDKDAEIERLQAENEKLRAALQEMYSAENYEQLSEMLDAALQTEEG